MRRFGWIALAAVLMPMPVQAQEVAPPLPDFGWFADGRRFQVGDIITIMVDEFTSASADRATSASEDRGSGAGLSVDGPADFNGGLNSSIGSESTRRGRDVRQDRLRSEVSVRVTDVEGNGVLRIEGTKMLTIDEHDQEVTVRGVIRSQDVTSMNTVDSWRLAEAEVLYSADGKLGQPEKGILMKLLGFIIP